MHQNYPKDAFASIENIAQIISLHNPKLAFLSTPIALKKLISIMPEQLKCLLKSPECLCDVFFYRTSTICANRAKFRIRTSNAGIAQLLRMQSNKIAIYDAICTYLKYFPNDVLISSLIKRKANEELTNNKLTAAEFIEWSLVINFSPTLARIHESRERARSKIYISRANQPRGEFAITCTHPKIASWLGKIRTAISERLAKIAAIDSERSRW